MTIVVDWEVKQQSKQNFPIIDPLKCKSQVNNENATIEFLARFTFERIHNTKEQIYFYKRAENHMAKERLFESFKLANFPGKYPVAGTDQGYLERGFVCI